MKWIEIITLRSPNKITNSLFSELLLKTDKNDGDNSLMSINIFRNAWISTDMSVHLHWKSSGPEQLGSTVGLRLVRALKEFGLVSHSAWVEEGKQGETGDRVAGLHEKPFDTQFRNRRESGGD